MIPLLLAAAALPQPTIAQAIAGMTLAEKAAQLGSGAPALPKAGLPAYDYWNEGLHGLARNGIATVFPQAIGLAATWDTDLLGRIGTVVSTEARAKYNAHPPGSDRPRYGGLTIWSPNINIFRDPRWGRGQETYGEDPYLAGRLAIGFVGGLQGPDPAQPRVIATPKHLAVHSGPEAGRDGFDIDVSPRDMAETYTPAFRAAIVDGRARSVMCAYNALHGVPVCASAPLLADRLRGDWGFAGLVVSDCDAVGNIASYHHYRPDPASAAAAALAAGTDLDCGHSYDALPDAVRRGLVPEAALDTALTRVFAVRRMLGGAFGATSRWDRIDPATVDTPAHRALALDAAEKAIVLLQNRNGRLPLARGTTIAVIGPDADSLDVLEANYHGTAAAPVTPLEGMRAAFGADRIRYAQGAGIAEGVAVPIPESALSADGRPGLRGAYYADAGFTGTPLLVRQDRHVDFDWNRAPPVAGLPPRGYAVRWTGTLTPPAPGRYRLRIAIPRCFDCAGHDPVRLWIDGRPVIDDGGDDTAIETTFDAIDTRPHAIRIDYIHAGEDEGIGLRWIAPADGQRDEAVRAARAADVVVAFVGLSPAVEGEALRIEVPGFAGGDRTAIELPAPQQRLIEAVAATGKPLVVVLMGGGAIAAPWAKDHADAVLDAWYPGQAGGTAIGRLLSGAANPSGRLPVTIYAATRDLPAFADYGMRDRTYRFFSGTPLYAFGHGLGYTRFAYADARLSHPRIVAGASVTASVRVTNAGARAGDEVVQAYLAPPPPTHPGFNDPVLRRALVGFARVSLKPGESRTLSFTLDPRALSTVDETGDRRVRGGDYRLWLGGGQPGDAPGLATALTITGDAAVAR